MPRSLVSLGCWIFETSLPVRSIGFAIMVSWNQGYRVTGFVEDAIFLHQVSWLGQVFRENPGGKKPLWVESSGLDSPRISLSIIFLPLSE